MSRSIREVIENPQSEKLQKLAERVDALKPSDRLRLAAALLDRGEYIIASTVAEGVVAELQALEMAGR